MGDPVTTLSSGAFTYLKDRLFLICCAAYAINRWGIKPLTDQPFLHAYFNDLLLIPCALPPLLWLHRRLRLRSHDAMPQISEVLLHLVAWSILFEWLGPYFITKSTPDPLDVVAYCIGALGAYIWWYQESRERLRQ